MPSAAVIGGVKIAANESASHFQTKRSVYRPPTGERGGRRRCGFERKARGVVVGGVGGIWLVRGVLSLEDTHTHTHVDRGWTPCASLARGEKYVLDQHVSSTLLCSNQTRSNGRETEAQR